MAVEGDRRHRARSVTLQLGQPPLGALQLRFPPGRSPDELGVPQLASFAVRAAHALRTNERAREAGFELERSRALLAVVGEAIARLSLSHTLDTAIERVADLLGSDRVAVYLREDGRSRRRGEPGRRRAPRGGGGRAPRRRPRARGADRWRSSRSTTPRPTRGSSDARPRSARRASARRSRCRSSSRDEPIGLLAVYPTAAAAAHRERDGAPHARSRAQLAVAVQNARLHERAKELGSELEEALDVGARGGEAAERALRDLALVRAEPFARDDARGARRVDRDAARRRRRGDPNAGRARAGAASRAQCTSTTSASTMPRVRCSRARSRCRGASCSRCSSARRPVLLDADRAEALGGALALLAPFLRKGSSAAVVPIATSGRAAGDADDRLAASRPPGRGRDRRDRALDRRAGRARDRQRPALRAAEGVRRHDAALAPAAGGARAAGPRARRRVRVGRPRRGRRRRLRLRHARRRPSRRRARRRHRPRRRRDRRHGDGEVRLPLARPRAHRPRRVPRRRERRRLLRDRARAASSRWSSS